MEASKYLLLHKLIDAMEHFEDEQKGDSYSLENFAAWLIHQVHKPMKTDLYHEEGPIQLAIAVGNMYRYARHYIKKILEPTILSTQDEFTFLADLADRGSIQKTALIQDHLLEITSGMEILKRLEKHGLIESFDDPDDKRSKLVNITNEGKKVLGEIMGGMGQVAQIIAGNLASGELTQLLTHLNKLEQFHHYIYQQDRKSSVEEVYRKYIE